MRIEQPPKWNIGSMNPLTTFKNKGKHYTVMLHSKKVGYDQMNEVMCFNIEEGTLEIFKAEQKGEPVDAVIDIRPYTNAKES